MTALAQRRPLMVKVAEAPCGKQSVGQFIKFFLIGFWKEGLTFAREPQKKKKEKRKRKKNRLIF